MKCCVIIPVYNHGEALLGTVERLSVYGLPTTLVDDGSDSQTKAAIAGVVAEYGLQLITLPENQGKGVAVQTGLRSVWEAGYTHAIQVDADGQHDLSVLASLIEEARKAPDALVCGVPQFGDDIPRSRLYGRYLTHFWVWVETLSLSIPDTMCGFRVYPLKSCIELIDGQPLGRRMEFDTEIAVRLYWRGVALISVPVRVRYPETGLSNFILWRDNWLITRKHTQLVFGMLIRLPMLIGRKLGVGRRHWSSVAERGGTLGLKFLFAAYKTLGRRVFTVLLYPVMTYFFLTSPRARRASREYLGRVESLLEREGRPLAHGLSSFRHFIQFGDAILDKTAMWAGYMSKQNIRYVDPTIYEDIIKSDRGGIFIGSHLGNLEALRAFGGIVQGMTVNPLVFTHHAVKFVQFLKEDNPRAVENIIQVDTLGPESIIRLQDKIQAGEWIAMVADRTSVSHEDRAVYSDFLGTAAPFPEGPFILAALLECPVYLLFCVKVDGRYDVYLEPFADPLKLPRQSRREDLQRVTDQYARRLEQHCLTTPYQWFNFFDFWQKPELRNGG